MVRPKLIEDGMFLVGLDIVGDKVLEINVFTPGGLPDIVGMHKIDFCEEIIEGLENKLVIRKTYGGLDFQSGAGDALSCIASPFVLSPCA